MDQKIAEKLKRSVRKIDKCKGELSTSRKDEIVPCAEALIKAEASHNKLLATIVESA